MGIMVEQSVAVPMSTFLRTIVVGLTSSVGARAVTIMGPIVTSLGVLVPRMSIIMHTAFPVTLYTAKQVKPIGVTTQSVMEEIRKTNGVR